LDSNQLSGSIPVEIGNLIHLQELYLQSNKLSGIIPVEIGNLINMQVLSLHSNKLSGRIPVEIGNLIHLQILYLHSNQLSGIIPAEIGNLINLQELSLAFNQLSGSIPAEIGNLIHLQILYLHSNKLSGRIPAEIGNLINLQILYLHSNQLWGIIPKGIIKKLDRCAVTISENYFMKEENLLNGWKCDNAFRPLPLELKEMKELQEVEERMKTMLQKLVLQPGRVEARLLLRNIPESEIEENMKKGKIPIGFSDSLVWQEINEKMKKLPKEHEEKEEKFEMLKTEEQKILEQLLQLEKAKLEEILKKTQHEKKKLEKEIQPWLHFKETHFQKASQFVQTIAEKEKNLAKRMDACRLSDDEFTSNCMGDTPLSLVFNAIGLSKQSIKQLQYLDEFEFLNANIHMECKPRKIPIKEQFELAYCQKLWNEQGVFPNKLHKNECTVCDHSTPEALCHLMEEHEKPFNMYWIKRENITGRRLIGMTVSHIRDIFPNNNEIKSTWMYFQRIHKQAVKNSKL